MASTYDPITDTYTKRKIQIDPFSFLDKYKTDNQTLSREITEIGTNIEEKYEKIYENLPEDIKQNGLPPDYKVSDAQIQNFINNTIDSRSEIIDNLKQYGFTIIGTSCYYRGKIIYEVKETDINILFGTLTNAFLEVAPLPRTNPPMPPITTPTVSPITTPTVLRHWRGGKVGFSKLFVDPRMVPFALLMASDPTLITASVTALVMLSCHIKEHLIKNNKIDETDYFHNLFKDLFKNEKSDETTDKNWYEYLYAILIGPCTVCENIIPCIINILTKSKDTLKELFQSNKGGKLKKQKDKKGKKTKNNKKKRQKTRKH